MINQEGFEEWQKSLQSMNFEDRAVAIKEKIVEGLAEYPEAQEQFQICFDYVRQVYKEGKPLEMNLLKIYLEQITGYKNIKMTEVINIMLLLSFCGFSFDEN